MDCKTARFLLELAHPQTSEFDENEAQALDAHLRDCSECGLTAEAERQADAQIGRVLRDVEVPASLRDHVEARLNRAHRLAYRRRAAGLAAAAALLLISTAGAWYWFAKDRPAISLADLVDNRNELPGMTADRLEEVFYRSYGLRTVLPRDFNYTNLLSYSQKELKGRLVPQLTFQREQNVAEVLVVSTRHFDLENTPSNSGGVTAILRANPTNPDIAYLITYTGESIDWLIDPGAL
jgi:hypothetical protein